MPSVFHEIEYGLATSSAPSAMPSSMNWTPATPMLSLADAETVTVPVTVALAAGLVMDTDGAVTSTTPVVNDHVKFAASGFPARSFTPDVPPFTVAVYVVELESVAFGRSVAVRVAPSYVTVEATTTFEGFLSSIVLVLTVAGSTASLNSTVRLADPATFVEPPAGETDVTVGGVVSGAVLPIVTGNPLALSFPLESTT